MSLVLWLPVLLVLRAEPPKSPAKLDRDTLIKAARPVTVAIVAAGARTSAGPRR